MTLKVRPVIEGKSKKFYEMNENECLMVFKPHLRSITSNREENIDRTDIERQKVNLIFMKILQKNGIPTHLIDDKIRELDGEKGILVKKVRNIPIEFICRFYASGSIVRLFPDLVSEGQKFDNMLLKFDYKQDIAIAGIDDPTMNESYIIGLKLLSKEQLAECVTLTKKVGEIINNVLNACNIKLIDMKMEFGIDVHNNILLIDEISQDCIRANDFVTDEPLTKDSFRNKKSPETVLNKYIEFRRRLEHYVNNL